MPPSCRRSPDYAPRQPSARPPIFKRNRHCFWPQPKKKPPLPLCRAVTWRISAHTALPCKPPSKQANVRRNVVWKPASALRAPKRLSGRRKPRPQTNFLRFGMCFRKAARTTAQKDLSSRPLSLRRPHSAKRSLPLIRRPPRSPSALRRPKPRMTMRMARASMPRPSGRNLPLNLRQNSLSRPSPSPRVSYGMPRSLPCRSFFAYRPRAARHSVSRQPQRSPRGNLRSALRFPQHSRNLSRERRAASKNSARSRPMRQPFSPAFSL